jgi:hypothetical protein
VSRSAFWSFRVVKFRHTIFMMGRTGTDSTKSASGTRYVELVFLHPVGSISHVRHIVRPRCA